MKRLTKRIGSKVFMSHDNCVYKNTSLACNITTCYNVALNRLAEYEDMEEQGLLVRLPCKVGDTVYWVTAIEDCEQCKHYDGITNMDDWECLAEECPQRIVKCKFKLDDLRLIEKTVFLTRESAEKALEEVCK